MRRQRTSSTLYKRNNKQLQNSLWLRICCSQNCFMHKRLSNDSTKFHFGNIENKTTTLKTTTNHSRYIKQRNVRNLWTAAKASTGLGLILPASLQLELEQLAQLEHEQLEQQVQQNGSTTTILP